MGREQGQHAENCCMHAAPLRGGGRGGAARRLPPLLHCAATAGDALYSLRRCCTARWQQQMQSFEAWWPAATGIDEQLKFEVCTCGDGDVDDVQEC